MKKKLLALLLIAILACSPFVIPVASADTEDDYKQQLSNLADKEAEYQEQLDAAKSDIKDKEAYSKTLVNQVDTLNEEIETYNSEISTLNDSIAEKQAAIDKANRDIEGQMNTLKKRLRTIYMAGETSDLEIILGAKDFSDFLDKVQLVKTLSDYDKELIGKIQTRLDKVSGEKEAMENEKVELEAAESQLQVKEDKLNTLLDENEEVLAGLYETKNNAQSKLEQAAAQEAEIQSQLDAYYEAQKKAAEEAAAKNNNNNNGGGNNGGSSGGGGQQVNPSSGGWTWPTPGCYTVLAPYGEDRGYSHQGIDIGAGMGATVVAAKGGTVITSNNSCTHNYGKSGSCGCGGGFGNYVIIDHGGGYSTTYGHLTAATVSTGQSVSAGQQIGTVGSTGWSTGAHLHFETRLNGASFDPMSLF
ncbi:MAG: peptidoglycan DD-metalloendopeptidase family protein [Ruminococcus sp.]|nr:peptidoglycan DD-metalloendopeptidase family protein [Ruminococcus sp.]